MPGTAQNTVRIGDLRELDDWAEGFEHLERDLTKALLLEWQTAADVMYEYSQEFAHVLSGEMKASSEGPVVSVPDPGTVAAEITYGPWENIHGHEIKPYAEYEHNRGGEHAFLTLAFNAAERDFGDALAKAFTRTVERFA